MIFKGHIGGQITLYKFGPCRISLLVFGIYVGARLTTPTQPVSRV